MNENEIRKAIWTRRDAVDAKMSEPGFAELSAAEQDAWVLSLQLDVPFDQAAACANGTASEAVAEAVRGKVAEAFKFGKRKALRPLKEVVSRCPALNVPQEGAEE